MADDIPPLISETPPPMTKLDWEDDEDFMDYPHSPLEIPSESSLSPDCGWNPIDEFTLPYDGNVINKPTSCIESTVNDKPPDIMKNDQPLESSIVEPESSLQQDNLSIWEGKDSVNKSMPNDSFDNIDESDHKTEMKSNLFSENTTESNSKIIDDSIQILNNIEQHIDNTKNNVTQQYLPNLELKPNNLEMIKNNANNYSETVISTVKSPDKDTMVNGNLEHEDIKQLPDKIVNLLSENSKNDENNIDANIDLSKCTYKNFSEDLPINNNNNNNNIIIKNSEEDDSFSFGDFKTAMPSSVPSPNRTFQSHDEITNNQSVEEHTSIKQFNFELDGASQNIFTPVNQNCEQNTELINPICSTIQNEPNHDTHIDPNLDSEFDDFCDFHTFSNSANEKEPTCVKNDFCDFETSTPDLNDSIEFKQSNIEQDKITTTNDNLSFKSNNQSSKDDDDDNFCDFESGYSFGAASNFHEQDQGLDPKPNDVILDSEFNVPLDYNSFCKDVFCEDNEFCEEIDLQNLDNELNNTHIWQNLKDIESSPALNYNWSKSEANNVFLSSLSIDSRNILYGASWNLKVPRFAANMSNNPLEPLKASINVTKNTQISQSFSIDDSSQEMVPDPEFDWKTSGLINPLDFQPQTWKSSEIIKEKELYVENKTNVVDEFFDTSSPAPNNQSTTIVDSPCDPTPTISVEAQKILDSLPDFGVLQKPYLVILENENKNNNLFLS